VADLQARDLKLIQFLNEAYGKEKQLETALEAHIAMTTRAPYKRRLQRHLRETKTHARDVERRIKKLGGKADAVDVPGPEAVTEAVNNAVAFARKSVAALQGPVHALRGTGEAEKLLRNARTELKEEVEEIATYTAIETLATLVGDKETAKVAKSIRRDEERMRDFLARLIPQLTKAVAQEELPAAERRGGRSTRRSSSRSSNGSRASGRSSRGRSSRGRSSSSRSKNGASSRSASRSSGGRSSSKSRSRSKSRSGGSPSRSRSGSSRSSRSRANK
jgi:ferritin-like metal-binding protein YciE